MKNEYIYERKGKKGITLQVIVPYGTGNNRKAKSVSVRINDYPSKSAAYEVARMKRDQIIMDIRNNKKLIDTPTVGELYEAFWEMSSSSINTKYQYDLIYNYVMAQLADRKIDEISAEDIQSVLSNYASDHSQQMVKKAKYIWHIVFLAAQMRGMNISDKTLMLLPIVSRKPARKNKSDKVISYNELLEFTAALLTDERTQSPLRKKTDRDIWYMIWIMYFTGCRPAEALAIDANDIDLENKILHIVKSVGSTKKKRRQIVATKRPSSYRHFPINDDLEVLLRDLLNHSDSTPLLLCLDGEPYRIGDIDQRIYYYSDLTGIRFNLYQLRHKFSDDMFANHINPVVVRDLMGHSSTSMSLEYAKATPEQMQTAVLGSKRESD